MHGIEKIKNAALAVIRFANAIEEKLEDGKINFVEGVQLAIGVAPDAFEVAQDAPELKKEFEDLTDGEMDELVDFVVGELDLDSAVVEDVAEAAFSFLVEFYKLFIAVRDAKPSSDDGE